MLLEISLLNIMSEPGSKNSLINKQVNTFLDEGDILWIGTEGGLDRYNKKDDTFKHFVHNPLNKKSIGSNSVWALSKDKRGNLWVGTWAGALIDLIINLKHLNIIIIILWIPLASAAII